MKQVRDLCNERDILLILDEIQCGMGRTGYMYAWQRFGVKPDIMTSAKALGCGVPVGAFMMTEKVAQHSLTAGDHGTTYGGNPLACAAVEKVLDLFEEDHIIEHVREVAPYLEQRLNELADKYDCIQERRGVGLMQGLVFDHPVGDIINKSIGEGIDPDQCRCGYYSFCTSSRNYHRKCGRNDRYFGHLYRIRGLS